MVFESPAQAYVMAMRQRHAHAYAMRMRELMHAMQMRERLTHTCYENEGEACWDWVRIRVRCLGFGSLRHL